MAFEGFPWRPIGMFVEVLVYLCVHVYMCVLPWSLVEHSLAAVTILHTEDSRSGGRHCFWIDAFITF